MRPRRDFAHWAATPVERTRARARSRRRPCWSRTARCLLALLQVEGGKTLDDAVSEWREAIDYCRYYAAQARSHSVAAADAGADRREQ